MTCIIRMNTLSAIGLKLGELKNKIVIQKESYTL